MKFQLADAYPRRWRGYHTRPAVRTQDYSTLQSLTTRVSATSNDHGQPYRIRNEVLAAIPVDRVFTCADVQSRTPGIDLEAVRKMISVLCSQGYPITRVGNHRPALYIMEGRL